MGRSRTEIDVAGSKCWTLFDSGARNSYVVSAAAQGLSKTPLAKPRQAHLGGGVHAVHDACLVAAEIEQHPVEFQAYVIDEIGDDEEGRRIEVLFGALAMQLWGIKLDLQNEQLDFSHYSRDLVEF